MISVSPPDRTGQALSELLLGISLFRCEPPIFFPEVPSGERLTAETGPGSKIYADFEKKGMEQLPLTLGELTPKPTF